MGDVTIVRGQGGLARTAPGQDYISALLFYNLVFPSGFTGSGNNIQQLTSAADAVNLGIRQVQMYVAKGSISGTFDMYEKVTGGTSGATGYVGGIGTGTINITGVVAGSGGLFEEGETITGATSSATITPGVTPYAATGFPDEIQGKGTVTAAAAGNPGDVNNIYFLMPNGANLLLCSYTTQSTDTTATLLAASIANAINVNNFNTGFTATSSGGVVSVYYAFGLGAYPNSGSPLTATVNGVSGENLTPAQDVTSGVASYLAQWGYHINEYFRINPTGNVYVGFFTTASQSWDFAELGAMQDFANGNIRQAGIYLGSNKTASNINTVADAIQATCANLSSLHTPLSVIYSVDIHATSDLTTLPSLQVRNDNWVSITIGQDGANQGAGIFAAQGYSIGNVGAVLGAVSSAAVNEDIGWVQQFNLTNGLELSVPTFGNGAIVNLISQQNLLTQLDSYRYIFLRYYQNYSGTFVNDNHCVITQTSDYAYINDNRVFDKASRLLYAAYLPALNGPLVLNADGTLTANTIAGLQTSGNDALDAMVRNSEISAYTVNINPSQNVLSTNKLVVGVSLEPDGVARTIEIDLGYVQTIS